jgi:pilus assembly protein Flp/PilA
MFTQAEKFWRDERAAVAIEYAMIATGIAFVIVSVVSGIGVKLSGYFSQVSGALK